MADGTTLESFDVDGCASVAARVLALAVAASIGCGVGVAVARGGLGRSLGAATLCVLVEVLVLGVLARSGVQPTGVVTVLVAALATGLSLVVAFSFLRTAGNGNTRAAGA